MVEVLYASNNNTSTNFVLILSTKYNMVEVVEIVEISSYPCGDAPFYDSELYKSN